MADYELILKDRRHVAEGTGAFWFDTEGKDYGFRAGQNADFTLIDPPATDGEGNTRTFSFASSPDRKDAFMIATRLRDTAFKRVLETLPPGSRLKVTAPMGSFTLHRDQAKPAVFVIGGIGITPVRSMIEWATGRKLSHKLYLFYSNRTRAQSAFLDDLEQWERVNPNFKLIATLTESREPGWRHEFGKIDRALLTRYLPDIGGSIYYLSGPPGMVGAMRKLLESLDVSEDNIKTEEFAGY